MLALKPAIAAARDRALAIVPISLLSFLENHDSSPPLDAAQLVATALFLAGSTRRRSSYLVVAVSINPDEAFRMIIVPPPQRVVNRRIGSMQSYMVAEPRNTRAISGNDVTALALFHAELSNLGCNQGILIAADWRKPTLLG